MERHQSAEADDGGLGEVEKRPTPVAVVAALRRLLDSDELRPSTRSRDFLAYVVTETLAGRGDRLKERTVARYALGRAGTFDASTDSTARVQATRLRGAMERYYAGAGAEEALVIELPKGSYVPTFCYRERPTTARPDLALRPGIAVVQFADLRAEQRRDLVPRALSDSIVRALSGFPELRVIGPVATERGIADLVDARAVARSFDVEYVLAGAVRSTEEVLRLAISVCDGATGSVVWSGTYDQERGVLAGFEHEDDVIRRIAATIGDVRGVIRRDAEQQHSAVSGSAGQSAVLAFYRFADSGSRADTESAARELLAALEIEPQQVLLLSMAGWIHVVLATMGWATDSDEAIASAERFAGMALARDPANAHAHQVLAGVADFRGLAEQCRTHALRAVELNPANASLLYTSGVLLARAGDWGRGIAMIRESNHLNPYHPGFQHVFLGIDRLLADDHAGALAEASLIHHPDELWGPLLRCLALAGLGYEESAGHELDAALAIEPRLLDDEALYVTDELRDAPDEARADLRRRLLSWMRSQDGSPARPAD